MFLRILADDVEEYSITLPLWRSVSVKWQVVWHSIHFSSLVKPVVIPVLSSRWYEIVLRKGKTGKGKTQTLVREERIKDQFLVSFCFFPAWYDNELYWNVLENEGEFNHGTKKCSKKGRFEVCVLFPCSLLFLQRYFLLSSQSINQSLIN